MGLRGRVTIALVSPCLWIGLIAPASLAAFPGDDGVIAFSYEAPVLTSGFFDANPAPSPSGTAIAFVSDRLGSFLPDLWTMEPDGSNPQVIADLMFASTTPDWQAIPAG